MQRLHQRPNPSYSVESKPNDIDEGGILARTLIRSWELLLLLHEATADETIRRLVSPVTKNYIDMLLAGAGLPKFYLGGLAAIVIGMLK